MSCSYYTRDEGLIQAWDVLCLTTRISTCAAQVFSLITTRTRCLDNHRSTNNELYFDW